MDPEEIDQIDRYLTNRLTPTEHRQFDEKLRQDPRLAMQVEQMRTATQLLRTALVEQKANRTLQELYRNQSRLVVLSIRQWATISLLAACVAGLLLLAFAPISLPAVNDDLLVLRQYPDTPPSSTDDASAYQQLLRGQNDLSAGNYLQAIRRFTAVVNEPDLRPYFHEAAQWHLALAYLRSNQPRKAEQYYDDLQKIDHPEYKVSSFERWKMFVQIQRDKWL